MFILKNTVAFYKELNSGGEFRFRGHIVPALLVTLDDIPKRFKLKITNIDYKIYYDDIEVATYHQINFDSQKKYKYHLVPES